MKLEEQPASRQFELKLYNQRCQAGVTPHCNLCRNIARRRFPFTLEAEVGLFRVSPRECRVCSAICDGLTGLQSSLQAPWNHMNFRFNACSETPRFYASEVIPQDGACRSKKFQLFTELGESRLAFGCMADTGWFLAKSERSRAGEPRACHWCRKEHCERVEFKPMLRSHTALDFGVRQTPSMCLFIRLHHTTNPPSRPAAE